jgi:bifunctional non-homologous end joining protein LigD
VPSSDGWAAEVKWDGFRIVAAVVDGKVSLRSRPGSNATDWFPNWRTSGGAQAGTAEG